MERKIGEIFEHNGEWYQCVEHKGCHNCAFTLSYGSRCSFNGTSHCAFRSDGKSVIFKKLEKVGEPYTDYCPSGRVIYFQRYKCYQKPAIPKETIIHWADDISVSIELKQTKEDMEEKKLNLKPFDLNLAKAGKPVCTRDGMHVRILCTDMKGCDYPIVALVEDSDGKEYIQKYPLDGLKEIEGLDLMMAPEKKEGWVNVYQGGKLDADYLYPSKEDAVENIFPPMKDNYIDTIKVEWEEQP